MDADGVGRHGGGRPARSHGVRTRDPRSARTGRTRAALAATALAVAALIGGCGADGLPKDGGTAGGGAGTASPAHVEQEYLQLPGVGAELRSGIPDSSRQAVVVYGESARSAKSTVALYQRAGSRWKRDRQWPAHNGRGGWTDRHRAGDDKSPVGVFTLSDAGGVLPDPGAKLPYDSSPAFTPPAYWSKNTRHDFDYVIAIDYNRVRGSSPIDPRRPRGGAEGGGIWLHLDHGSGTSACVSLSAEGMRHLLRTLDPAQHPVIVMGDRARLRR